MIISQIGYKFNQFSNFPLVVNYPQNVCSFSSSSFNFQSWQSALKWLEVMKSMKMCLFQIVGSVLHQLEAQRRCEYLFIIQTQQSKQFHFVPFFPSIQWYEYFLCDGQWLCLTWKKAWMERKGRETRNCLNKGLKWLTAQLIWAYSPDILSVPLRSQTCCPRHTCQVLIEKQLCHT